MLPNSEVGSLSHADMIDLVSTKVLADQRLDRAEIPIREVLEAPFAVEQGFRHGCERLGCAQEVIVVVHQLEFDRSREGGGRPPTLPQPGPG